MSSEKLCACGAKATHEHVEGDPCCWCHVVEHGRVPFEGHADCQIASKRISAIQTRFQTAISAEREACAKIVEELKHPLEAMPPQLRHMAKKSPEYVLQAILDNVVRSTAKVIRARIGRSPTSR